MEKEERYLSIIPAPTAEDYRSNPESRQVNGYAIVFNSLSEDLGGFREIIAPEAVEGVIEKSDIVAVLNHDQSRGILGRSRNGEGSLQLSVDETGTAFRFDAPKTALGDECLEYLRRGDATQCSFAFAVKEDSWRKLEDGMYERTIKKFDRLYDVSILTCQPAYAATSVSCRSFDEFKEQEARELEEARKAEEAAKAEEEKRQAEEEAAKLAEYYKNLREENKDYLNNKE